MQQKKKKRKGNLNVTEEGSEQESIHYNTAEPNEAFTAAINPRRAPVTHAFACTDK